MSHKIGRMLVLLVGFMLLLGCVGTGPTPDQSAALVSERDQNEALARNQKITWTEAAQRNNALLESMAGNRLSGQERLLMAYRLALAAEVDAGRMTPEMAKYQMEEKKTEIISYSDAQQRQAFANLANVGLKMMQTQPAPPPVVTCTTTPMGQAVNTVCH